MRPISEEEKRFLTTHIESVDQLEILRVLGEDPAREWSLPALAGVMQALPQVVAAHLAALQARGMLSTVVAEPGPRYRHGARTAELEAQLSRLLHLYRERPVTLIKIVYAHLASLGGLTLLFWW